MIAPGPRSCGSGLGARSGRFVPVSADTRWYTHRPPAESFPGSRSGRPGGDRVPLPNGVLDAPGSGRDDFTMPAKEKLPDGEGRPPGAMPTAPSVQRLCAERYVVEEELGRGGMGRVVRARDLKLDRAVALKFLPPGVHDERQRMRFEQEARAAGALNHPNIVAVYDVGEHEGEPYIVTELLEGETLREALESGPLAPQEVLEFAIQLAEGLAAAHRKGIVHRDLKPDK